MARTYPAKRSRLAHVSDVALDIPEGLGGGIYTYECEVCDIPLQPGDRVVSGRYAPRHARCADAGEALP